MRFVLFMSLRVQCRFCRTKFVGRQTLSSFGKIDFAHSRLCERAREGSDL